MERQLERCAGLDVHRDTVAACVRVPGRGGHREQHVQTFGTTAAELLRLREWHGVTDVAMESTASIGNRSTTCSRRPWPEPFLRRIRRGSRPRPGYTRGQGVAGMVKVNVEPLPT
jgi:hypothetical protein